MPEREDVDRGVPVSVRFTEPMDRASTAAAFSVEVNGKEVTGTVDFAEDDTVLVFDPKLAFPYPATVILRVCGRRASPQAARRSTGGGPPRFTVVAKPKPRPKPAAGRSRATADPSRRPAPAPKSRCPATSARGWPPRSTC